MTVASLRSPSLVPEKAVLTVQAHIVGIVRGREIDSEATLELDEESIGIVWSRATPWRLALDGIDGLHVGGGDGAVQLTLYLSSGDVLELTGDDRVRAFGAAVVERACVVPELTRGLRALGSRRGALGASHDAWFAPLLAARRAIEGVSDPLRQVELLNAERLRENMMSMIAELAAIRAPADAAMRRAIEAVLEEECEPMFEAIDHLAVAADALRGGGLDTRLLDWRRWMGVVREVFEAVDEGWGGWWEEELGNRREG